MANAVGEDRTSVRLSPNGEVQGADDPDPIPLFTAAASALDQIGIASLEIREPRPNSVWLHASHPPIHPSMREVFRGPFIINSEQDRRSAEHAIESGGADAVSFGRAFISNPDLPAKLARNLLLTKDVEENWYLGEERGYTDYPMAVSEEMTQ